MNRGFTLMEMIVAITVFSVVVAVSLGSILNISHVQKKANSFRLVQDNLNFALEMMAKSIRVGKSYSCGEVDLENFVNYLDLDDKDHCFNNGGPAFKFIDAKQDRVIYRRKVNDNGIGVLEKIKVDQSDQPISFEELTSPEVNIERLFFYVKGARADDDEQPMVTIVLTGVAGKEKVIESRTNLQITISQRIIDS